MADKTKIEWTDASWSPIRARCWEIQSDGSGKERLGWHCEHVSEGCRNCYAEKINLRLGTGYDFKPGNLRGKAGYAGGGNERPELFLDEKMLLNPLRWKRPRMIFVCSMTDLFADFVSDEMIDKVFAVMALCPQHTFQVLTKRAERMREYMASAFGSVSAADRFRAFATFIHEHAASEEIAYQTVALTLGQPLDNVWLGVSTERQKEADERIPLLLQTPAAVRFVSAEPLLGPIDLRYVDQGIDALASTRFDNLDWVIVGGESGHDSRPMHPDWARALRDQCAAAGVPFFFKQWGEWRQRDCVHVGRDHAVFNSDGSLTMGVGVGTAVDCLRSHVVMERIGKKAAGRLLDGKTHDAMPSQPDHIITPPSRRAAGGE